MAAGGMTAAALGAFVVFEDETPSHDAGRNGSPDSFNQSHNGSGPSGLSMKKVIRSATVASVSGVRPTTPSRSRQCSRCRCRPVWWVTSRIGRSSYRPIACARRTARAREDSTYPSISPTTTEEA
ncbi:hypothetical protein [Streptomyces lutosisoli]|uniref:hypothetical protein n=1 Tax=Streptomyces lutosisoli TaxID=2665721 RepID=UPI00360A2D24